MAKAEPAEHHAGGVGWDFGMGGLQRSGRALARRTSIVEAEFRAVRGATGAQPLDFTPVSERPKRSTAATIGLAVRLGYMAIVAVGMLMLCAAIVSDWIGKPPHH